MSEPLEYHQLQRLGRRDPWRPIVGVVLLVVGLFALWPVVLRELFTAGFAITGGSVDARLERLYDVQDPSPLTLVYINLVLASAIPISIAISRALHGLRPGWLMSVASRIRWRFMLACVGLSVVALLATLLVSSLVPQAGGTELSGEPNQFTSTTRDFLIVIAILTPLQAAGEEFAFRGYLVQACGGLFGNRIVAVLLSSLLFALAHGLGQDLPLFVDRLAFGLVAGTLVILTGGLEAGIAMHVLNNFFAFALALAFTDMGSALTPTDGTWWSLPGTLTQSIVYLVLATWLARRMGLDTAVTTATPRGPA